MTDNQHGLNPTSGITFAPSPSDDAHDSPVIDRGVESRAGGASDGPAGPEGAPGAPGTPGEGDPARKRRRRRGGKGRKKNGAPPAENGAVAAVAPVETGSEPRPPQPQRQPQQAPPQHSQPRRESSHGGGRGDRDHGRDRGPRNDHHNGPRESGDGPEFEPPVRERKTPVLPAKEWEEIFEGKTFASLGLRNSVLKGVEAAGFKNPTKIQADMIPHVLAGKDVLGQSRTGTGKTAAFGLPLLHCAQWSPTQQVAFQSLILAPTRELAVQIAAELTDLAKHTPLKISAVYGGQAVHAQAKKLDKGPEIIVATPGRLMDMVERGHIHLRNVRFAVLDEVDRMLDIGFRDDIRKILSQIKGQPHQTIFVSATISEEIERLARTYMNNPEKLVTTGGSLTVSLVQQHYITVEPWDKRRLLTHLLTHEEPDLTVIFCRMKRTVDDVTKHLIKHGIDAHGIHGDMYQGKRNTVMSRLRAGQLGVLVASDLAARGLDVDGISHVINYDLPEDAEIYIHRIGRTARAGRGGVAWSLVCPDQGELLTNIEMLANTHIPEMKYPDFKPGPVPVDIQSRREADQQRVQVARSQNRFQANALPVGGSAAPAAVAAPTSSGAPAPVAPRAAMPALDPARFPGGVIPTKLPPRMMGGRVKTARSMKSAPPAAMPAQPAPAAPAADAPSA